MRLLRQAYLRALQPHAATPCRLAGPRVISYGNIEQKYLHIYIYTYSLIYKGEPWGSPPYIYIYIICINKYIYIYVCMYMYSYGYGEFSIR